MRDRHIAAYGRIALERAYCDSCHTTAIIVDGRLQCCDKRISASTEAIPIQGMSTQSNKRQTIKKAVKDCILEFQSNTCFHCRIKFGSWYTKKKHPSRLYQTKPVFDHVQPFVNGGSNKHNIVASCNLCNSFKGSKVFGNILEIGIYTKKRLKETVTFI